MGWMVGFFFSLPYLTFMYGYVYVLLYLLVFYYVLHDRL